MKKTKIDWCDCTVNPVVGCKNGCPYCYAKKINDRFHIVEDWNEPQFFPERLKEFESKKPKSIFVNSMSDVGLWNINQIRKVAKSIKNNPQHNYLFLTKRPDLFCAKCKSIVEEANNNNVYVGATITKRADFERLLFLPVCARRFVSIEPIMEDLGDLSREKCDLFRIPYVPEVIIIGAETGNRKNKIIPQKEWITRIVKEAEAYNKYYRKSYILQKNGWYEVKIFMKESLRSIMGEDFRQDKLPWDIAEKEIEEKK